MSPMTESTQSTEDDVVLLREGEVLPPEPRKREAARRIEQRTIKHEPETTEPWWLHLPPIGSEVRLRPSGKRIYGGLARVLRYEKRGYVTVTCGMVVEYAGHEAWVRLGECELVAVSNAGYEPTQTAARRRPA